MNERINLADAVDRIARYRKLARQKYAWPGGYRIWFLADDGGILCSECVLSEPAHVGGPGLGWRIDGVFTEAEVDPEEYSGCGERCSHCDRPMDINSEGVTR